MISVLHVYNETLYYSIIYLHAKLYSVAGKLFCKIQFNVFDRYLQTHLGKQPDTNLKFDSWMTGTISQAKSRNDPNKSAHLSKHILLQDRAFFLRGTVSRADSLSIGCLTDSINQILLAFSREAHLQARITENKPHHCVQM